MVKQKKKTRTMAEKIECFFLNLVGGNISMVV